MLNKMIEKYAIEEVVQNDIGCSGDQVYFLKSKNKNYYLKLSKKDEIIQEAKVGQFLKDKIPVPKTIEYGRYEQGYYFLKEELPGKVLYELLEKDVMGTIEIYANTLKQLHQITIQDFPYQRDLKSILQSLPDQFDSIDLDEVEPITKQRGLQKTYERLCELLPKQLDLVISHGDYCMPNVIVGKEIGLIDLGKTAIDDRYNDLALGLRSLKYNLHLIGIEDSKEYLLHFLNTYGITDLDRNKIEFYYLLDEFF